MASLVETRKFNAVDPQRYLADTLTRLVNGWRRSRIDDLMPWSKVDEKEIRPSSIQRKGHGKPLIFDPSPSRTVDRFVEPGALRATDNALNYHRFREAY